MKLSSMMGAGEGEKSVSYIVAFPLSRDGTAKGGSGVGHEIEVHERIRLGCLTD
jgi:hypothetical protein